MKDIKETRKKLGLAAYEIGENAPLTMDISDRVCSFVSREMFGSKSFVSPSFWR